MIRSSRFFLALVAIPLPFGCAQDEVQLRQADESLVVRTGLVIRYDAEELVLRSAEREQTFPSDRVVGVASPWDRLALPAEQLFQSRQFESAYGEFGKGNEAATPAWFRQRLLAGRVRAARELGSWFQAVTAFVELYQADPQSRFASTVPLAWSPSRPDPQLEKQIEQLLKSKQPIYQLLGASHGLAGLQRETAVATLKQLARDIDPIVARLAECQLWRLETQVPPAAILEEREQKIRQLPEPWQAGPWWLLGNQWAAEDPEKSTLILMRIPILYPDQFQLSARALLAAGDRLNQLGRSDEATTVWHELVDRHEGTPEARAARERLAR